MEVGGMAAEIVNLALFVTGAALFAMGMVVGMTLLRLARA